MADPLAYVAEFVTIGGALVGVISYIVILKGRVDSMHADVLALREDKADSDLVEERFKTVQIQLVFINDQLKQLLELARNNGHSK